MVTSIATRMLNREKFPSKIFKDTSNTPEPLSIPVYQKPEDNKLFLSMSKIELKAQKMERKRRDISPFQ